MIGLAVAAYIVWPLLGAGGEESIHAESDDAFELIQRKDAALRSIKEVEFDFQMGKLSEEDFNQLNRQLRQQAIALLRRIESSSPEVADLEQSLEKDIASARNT